MAKKKKKVNPRELCKVVILFSTFHFLFVEERDIYEMCQFLVLNLFRYLILQTVVTEHCRIKFFSKKLFLFG